MEDRYLSKAKRIDNGEWVEGYLIFSFTGIPYIVQEYDHILEVMQMYEVEVLKNAGNLQNLTKNAAFRPPVRNL